MTKVNGYDIFSRWLWLQLTEDSSAGGESLGEAAHALGRHGRHHAGLVSEH
jgi:hypothetical protein